MGSTLIGESTWTADVETARAALHKASSPDALVKLFFQAGELVARAQTARLSLQLQNCAAEIRVWSAYAAGAELRRLKLRGGDRRPGSSHRKPALCDYGIDKYESSDWQKLARWPEDYVRQAIFDLLQANRELTVPAVLRKLSSSRRSLLPSAKKNSEIHRCQAAEAISRLAEEGRRYGCILITPNNMHLGGHMTCIEKGALCRLKQLLIGNIAYPDATVHLFVLPHQTREAIRVIDSWGFKFLSASPWLGTLDLPAVKANSVGLLLHAAGKERTRADADSWSLPLPDSGKSIPPAAKIVPLLVPRCQSPFLHIFAETSAGGWSTVSERGVIHFADAYDETS